MGGKFRGDDRTDKQLVVRRSEEESGKWRGGCMCGWDDGWIRVRTLVQVYRGAVHLPPPVSVMYIVVYSV